MTVDADIRLRCANQGDAVHQHRRRIAGSPCAVDGAPLQRHAVAAEIEHRNRRSVIGAMPQHAHSRCVENLIVIGVSANALCTIPAVSSCGSRTGCDEPGFELYTTYSGTPARPNAANARVMAGSDWSNRPS